MSEYKEYREPTEYHDDDIEGWVVGLTRARSAVEMVQILSSRERRYSARMPPRPKGLFVNDVRTEGEVVDYYSLEREVVWICVQKGVK